MKTILISFFNSTNLGDLILSENMRNLLAHDSTVKCYSFPGFARKAKIAAAIQDSNDTAACKNGIKSKIIPIYRYLRIRYLQNYEEIELDIADADRIVIGGGNMLMDLDFIPNYIAYFHKLVEISEKYHKKVWVLCVGVGPLQNKWQEKMLCSALNKCERIATRDRIGRDLLERLGLGKTVEVCPDCAFLEKKSVQVQEKRAIAVNICLAEEYKEAYRELILQTNKRFPEYKVILFSTEIKDYADIEHIRQNKDIASITETLKVYKKADLYALYAQTKLVVATRMHAMILAYTQNVPVIGLSWSKKIDGLFDLMQRPQDVFAQNKLRDSIGPILCSLSGKIECYDQECAHIRNMVEKNRQIIERTFLGGKRIEF